MSDTFGLLELPAPEPDTDEAALTDPALDMVLAFCKAVINAEMGDAWAARCASSPEPVEYTFNHNPDLESFNADETPALYMWRADDNDLIHKHTQDLVSDGAGFAALWVPPPGAQEDKRSRAGFRNGIRKALKAALAQGRHPAWVVDGDDYYEPDDYGSVLLYHTKLSKCRLGAFKTHTLVLENEDRSGKQAFECLYFTLDTLEFFTFDPTADNHAAAHPPVDHVQGTVKLVSFDDEGEPRTPLEIQTFHFEQELVTVEPDEGDAAGGTDVVIGGKQFTDLRLLPSGAEILVYLGTTAELDAGTAAQVSPSDVELVEGEEETQLAIVTPAHAAGVVSVRVVFPSGVTKTLADAYEYT